jgi:plasmid stability protein
MHKEAYRDASMEEQMKAVTVRNLPPELVRIIRRKASEKGISVNKAVINLLEERAGIRAKKRKQAVLYHDLDHLAGSWSREEAATFERALAEQRRIDPEAWE